MDCEMYVIIRQPFIRSVLACMKDDMER